MTIKWCKGHFSPTSVMFSGQSNQSTNHFYDEDSNGWRDIALFLKVGIPSTLGPKAFYSRCSVTLHCFRRNAKPQHARPGLDFTSAYARSHARRRQQHFMFVQSSPFARNFSTQLPIASSIPERATENHGKSQDSLAGKFAPTRTMMPGIRRLDSSHPDPECLAGKARQEIEWTPPAVTPTI